MRFLGRWQFNRKRWPKCLICLFAERVVRFQRFQTRVDLFDPWSQPIDRPKFPLSHIPRTRRMIPLLKRKSKVSFAHRRNQEIIKQLKQMKAYIRIMMRIMIVKIVLIMLEEKTMHIIQTTHTTRLELNQWNQSTRMLILLHTLNTPIWCVFMTFSTPCTGRLFHTTISTASSPLFATPFSTPPKTSSSLPPPYSSPLLSFSLQGCGKTVLLELAVLKLHHEWITDPSTSPSASFPYSIVYVCPTKALCNEIFTKWSSTFASLGLKCVVRHDRSLWCRKSQETQTLSSRVCVSSKRFTVELHKQLASFHIIFTTPEKLEILSRRWSAPFGDDSFVERLRLLMIDEIHLLNEPRGANIETIISRLRSNPRLEKSCSEECAARRSFPDPTRHAFCDVSEQRGCGAVAPRQAFLVRFELSSRSHRAHRDRVWESQPAQSVPLRGSIGSLAQM